METVLKTVVGVALWSHNLWGFPLLLTILKSDVFLFLYPPHPVQFHDPLLSAHSGWLLNSRCQAIKSFRSLWPRLRLHSLLEWSCTEWQWQIFGLPKLPQRGAVFVSSVHLTGRQYSTAHMHGRQK